MPDPVKEAQQKVQALMQARMGQLQMVLRQKEESLREIWRAMPDGCMIKVDLPLSAVVLPNQPSPVGILIISKVQLLGGYKATLPKGGNHAGKEDGG